MSTFSQIVDDLLHETKRFDMALVIAGYLNQTIREVHNAPGTQGQGRNLPILYGSNRDEDEFTVATLPALWPIPSVPRFQRLERVYYTRRCVIAKERNLSKISIDSFEPNHDVYWYRTGPMIALSGAHVAEVVRLSYFMFPRSLKFYLAADRPAVYDPEEDEFTYPTNPNPTPEEAEELIDRSTNWLLLRWPETMKQGLRAKIYSRLGEEGRARMAYSHYETLRADLQASEQWQQNPE